MLGNVFQGAYPNWTVGVQIGYPLGIEHRAAPTSRARNCNTSRRRRSAKISRCRSPRRCAASAATCQTNQKRVQSTRASRELQEKKLEAEQKKLAAGLSSTFFVLQAQRDLALARTIELQAISDYNKSLVDFEAVQEVPVGGNIGGDHHRRQRRAADRRHHSHWRLERKRWAQAASPQPNRRPALAPPSCLRYTPSVPKVSVTVITKNEAADIARALRSVAWADEIIVVDSAEHGRHGGDRAPVHRPRRSCATGPGTSRRRTTRRRSRATTGSCRSTPTSASRRRWRPRSSATLDGDPATRRIRMPRVTWHLGRWIRTTDWYPDYQLRLYDRRVAEWTGRYVHESVTVRGTRRPAALRAPALRVSRHRGSPRDDRSLHDATRRGRCSEDGRRAGVLQIAGHPAARVSAQLHRHAAASATAPPG